MYLVTAKQMRAIDKAAIESFGIPGQILMENAGRGAVDMLLEIFPEIRSRRVCILAGRGNNGGDAFVMARYLMEKEIEVNTFLLSSREKVTGDAKANLALLDNIVAANKKGSIPISGQADSKGVVTIKENLLQKEIIRDSVFEIPDLKTFRKYRNIISSHHIFVDGILGTGLNSDVRGFLKEVIETVNSLSKPVFSIDIPSGLNADNGQPMGISIKATATATFGFAKTGHLLYPGKELSGTLEIIDIGIPGFIARKENPSTHLIEQPMIKRMFRPREPQSHKGTYGHLLVVAGSTGKTGAAALAANAAMACGTGLVTLAVPESINSTIEPQVTEPMTFPLPESNKGHISHSALNILLKELVADKKVIAAGPGLGTDESTIKLVHGMVEEIALPMILDADALNAIAMNPYILKSRKAPTIVTPHPGEMARLTGKSTSEVQRNRIETATHFAVEFNATVVLKGASTLIALPDGTVHICPTGNPGMASGGMGDVLTGMIAGLAAQGFNEYQAAIAGVYIHGLCGDILAHKRGASGFVASDIIRIIPETIHGKICP
ncbi:MAG: NAD(P)H-hydrate dehydratase [Desulfamplus sp.]|nr:NAD(P)H-hydrate dehydratase [Desulfamplus sp.]